MEANKNLEVKSSKSKTSIILVVIIAILLGIIAFLLVTIMGEDKKEEKKVEENVQEEKEEKKVEENVQEEKEVDITNKALKEEFSNYIDIIDSVSLEKENEKSNLNNIYSIDEVTVDKLSKSSIFGTVLFFDYKSFIDLDDNEKYDSYVEATPYIEKVYNLFGNVGEVPTKMENCMSFTYNKKENRIYSDSGSGCGAGPYAFATIDKITEKGNNRYVYVYVGSVSPDGFYSDPDLTKKYKDEDEEEVGDDFIEKNYKDFTPYKYTFTKNADGYYIFTKLEKIK